MTIPNLNPSDPQQVLNPQNNFQPSQQSDNSQSQTQQTSNSQNQVGAPSDLSAFAQELAALRAQNQQMFQMITSGGFGNNQNQVRQVQQPQLPEVPEIPKDQFWDNPGQSTRTLVETLMNRALAPINQNISAFVNQQQYERAKQQMKMMPQYNALIRMEPVFDNVVNNAINSGIPLTDGLLTTSYYTALGIAMQNGMLAPVQQQQNNQQGGIPQQQNPQSNAMVVGQQTQFQQNTQQQSNLVTPPYLAGNNTQQQQNNSIPRFRPLEENEEILRKKSGMSTPEFLFYGNEISEEIFKAADPQGHARYVNPSGRK